MVSQPTSMKTQEWGLLIVLSILWGGAFFFAGIAIKELPPLTVVLVRVGLAAVILFPVFWYYGHKLPHTFSEWMPFLGMGLLNNVLPFGFLFAGQAFITIGLTSIINAMTPLFTIMVMASFIEESLTLPRLAGVLVGVLGVTIITGPQSTIAWPQILGILLCLAGTLSYGFAALWGRRYLSGVAPMKSATCQLIASTVLMLFIVSVIDQPWNLELPSLTTLWALLALAIFSTALAYIIFFEVLVRAGASNVVLVTLLIPVTAILLGYFFLHETIKLQEVAGALIIGLGLLLIDGRALKIFKKTSRINQ